MTLRRQLLRRAKNKAPETSVAGPSPLFSMHFAPRWKQLLTRPYRLCWFKYNRENLAGRTALSRFWSSVVEPATVLGANLLKPFHSVISTELHENSISESLTWFIYSCCGLCTGLINRVCNAALAKSGCPHRLYSFDLLSFKGLFPLSVAVSELSVSRAVAVPLPEPAKAQGVCVPSCSGLQEEIPKLFPAGRRTLWCSGGVDHSYIAASPRSPFRIYFSQGGSS